MEQWKKIEGFPNYSVSPIGNVRNDKTGRVLKGSDRGKGYLCVNLYKDGKRTTKYIHQLVAQTFITNPENKQTVDHVNRKRDDNRVENLCWATLDEQLQNSVKSKQPIIATKNGVSQEFESISECARVLGLDVSAVNKCLQGKRKTHHGYTFTRK